MPGELLEIALGGAPRATRQELGLGEVGTEQLIVTSMGTATEILCKVLKKRRMWKDLSLNFLCRAGHRAEGNGGLVDKVLGGSIAPLPSTPHVGPSAGPSVRDFSAWILLREVSVDVKLKRVPLYRLGSRRVFLKNAFWHFVVFYRQASRLEKGGTLPSPSSQELHGAPHGTEQTMQYVEQARYPQKDSTNDPFQCHGGKAAQPGTSCLPNTHPAA